VPNKVTEIMGYFWGSGSKSCDPATIEAQEDQKHRI